MLTIKQTDTITIKTIRQQLAPVQSKLVSFSHSAPWYTDELRHLKSKRRLERLAHKTGLTVHQEMYKQLGLSRYAINQLIAR